MYSSSVIYTSPGYWKKMIFIILIAPGLSSVLSCSEHGNIGPNNLRITRKGFTLAEHWNYLQFTADANNIDKIF